MNPSICGADCSACPMKQSCRGCVSSEGCPFGKPCFIASYIKLGGEEAFCQLKQQLLAELNALHIEGLPAVEDLYPLAGSFVNLAYPLPNGNQVPLLDDSAVYLGTQLHSEFGGERCFGIVADPTFLLICTYGDNGSAPELVLYKKR